MSHIRIANSVLLLTLAVMAPVLSFHLVPKVNADTPFSLNPLPAFALEGSTISLVLSVNGANSATKYQFRFFVRDPASITHQSVIENYTTLPGQNQFTLVVVYPSSSFPGSTSLVGQYITWVDLFGSISTTVAGNSFTISITDNASYERTQTVNIQASGYNASESVSATIRTQTTSTLVFYQTMTANTGGIVSTSWKIPRNATIDNYGLTVTGTNTVKNPADFVRFSIRAATMFIAAIASSKATYQRTETMQFSFQPIYPDGSTASTGAGLLTLSRPDGVNVTLTATYDNLTQAFTTSYTTFADNQTGTWNATLAGHAYSDAYGNISPFTKITNAPQLLTATLTVNASTGTSFAVGQQIKFNITITYPDGTILQSGTVRAYLLYTGTQTVNKTVPVVFDTSLRMWIGTYTWQSTDPGGLWSLVVRASDSPTPPNTGSATRAISLQNNNASFPLYYFGLVAALIAGALIGLFLFFRRRKVTHARLKIDLEAVKSEAGRIESQDFFKSVKDQVKKEKDD